MNAGPSTDRKPARNRLSGLTVQRLLRRRWLAGLGIATLLLSGGCIGANLTRTPQPNSSIGPMKGMPDSAPFSRAPATSNIFSEHRSTPGDPRVAPPLDPLAPSSGDVRRVTYQVAGEPLPPGPEGEVRGSRHPGSRIDREPAHDPVPDLFASPGPKTRVGRPRAADIDAMVDFEREVPELNRPLRPVRPKSPAAYDHDQEVAVRAPAPVSFPLQQPPTHDSAVRPAASFREAEQLVPALPPSLLPESEPAAAQPTVGALHRESPADQSEAPESTSGKPAQATAADRALILPAELSLEDLTIPTLIYSAPDLIVHVDRASQDQFVVPTPIQSVLLQKVRGPDRGRMLWRPVFENTASFGAVSDGAWDIFHLTVAIPTDPEIARADAEDHVRRHQPRRRILVDRSATSAPDLAATELPWRTSEGARQARTLLPVAWSTGRSVARVQSLAGEEAEGTIRPETREGWRLLRKGLIFRAMRQFAEHLEGRSPAPKRPTGSLVHGDHPSNSTLGEILGASTSVTGGLRGNGRATADLTNRLSEECPADLDGAMALLGWAKALDAAGRERPPLVDQADELALAGYLAAARIDGNAHGALNDAGVLLYRMRRPAEAVSLLLAAQRESEEPLVAHNLGCVYAELGRHVEAIATWRWAADTDRTLLATRRALVRHQLRDGAPALHPDQARQLMGALKRIESGSGESVVAMPFGYSDVSDVDRQIARRIVQSIWFLGKEMAANGSAPASGGSTPRVAGPALASPMTTPSPPVVPSDPMTASTPIPTASAPPASTPRTFETPPPVGDAVPPMPLATPPKLAPAAGANRPTDASSDPAPARLDPTLRDAVVPSAPSGTNAPGRNP